MNVAAVLSVVAAVNGIAIAALAWRVGAVPNWTHKRLFAFVMLCASTYCACDVLTFEALTPAHFVALIRIQGAAATLHVAAWFVYTFSYLGIRRPRTRTAVVAAAVFIAALWLVPGLMVTDRIGQFSVDWLRATYRVQTTTTLGTASFAIDSLAMIFPLVLYIRRRHQIDDAYLHAGVLIVGLVCALSDVIVAVYELHAPFTLPLGCLVSIVALGTTHTRAFIDSARARDELTKQLQELVAQRTNQLHAAEGALVQAEKLVAIGKLSAGVAHEVNNPAAAISANLDYLRESVERGILPPDALDCIDESSEAVQRIAKIVRQLLDSARAAATPQGGGASIHRAIAQALATVKPQLKARVQVEVDVAPSVFARGDEASLVQIFANLVSNGAQAIPLGQEHARIQIRAREEGSSVVVEVEDNGTGIPEELRTSVFEPFFTTKPFGEGTGLGLAVSLGLVRSMGGNIEIVSVVGKTIMRVRLVKDTPPTPSASMRRAHAQKPRLLLLDDNEGVRNALMRSLRGDFDVTLATSISDGLEKIERRPFDLVLSDWQMPEGDGRRFFDGVHARDANVARKIVFFSGGAPSSSDQAWIEQVGSSLLRKPLAIDDLFTAIGRINKARSPSPSRSVPANGTLSIRASAFPSS